MKKILLLATGGTIASRNLGEGLTPALTAEELLGCVPEIADVCDVTAEQVCNLDSTNMRPEHWVQIARRVQNRSGDGYLSVDVRFCPGAGHDRLQQLDGGVSDHP